MNVLLIGGGGREHALAAALLRSPKLSRLHVAPGNAGTAEHNIDLDVADHDAVVAYCRAAGIDLVVVGPEGPLVGGLSDDLVAAGFACFGPSAEAARIEGSKSFAREFSARHGIPGPQAAAFSEVAEAIAWLDRVGDTAVIKADGLAAGKGVVVPTTRHEAEQAIRTLLAEPGAMIVVEEQMVGEELSLFGICDGTSVLTLAAAQDHKRVGVGDTGPNTGGMGAFSPVPGIDREREDELADIFLRPVVEGMADEGSPYVGVLYAGLMLTDAGPRLVEYNCRFGDPEAQVVLPRLQSDLLELLDAAAHKELASIDIVLSPHVAAGVVVAAPGYPGPPVVGIPVPPVEVDEEVLVFHAGTVHDEAGDLVSSGGRVLSVVAMGTDLGEALDGAYAIVDQFTKAGLFARPDIGWRHACRAGSAISAPEVSATASAYSAAGVSLDAGAVTASRISAAVKSTHDDRVVAAMGSFGGVFDISAVCDMQAPLLVATTDGVGTKTILAKELDRWEGCGADIVNHCINDVLVQGARPLFFLDTVVSETLDPEVVGRVVDGMASACREGGCVLLGGETAEMPGVLVAGSVDIAGTLVGVVDRHKLLPRPGIAAGYVLVGLASSGLHTNGYSLARKVVRGRDLSDSVPGADGTSIGEALLAVHRSYLSVIERALDADLIDALAHITGGGLVDNIPRILPDDVAAVLDSTSWETPPLFRYLISEAGLGVVEANQIFNCGIGMVAVVAPGNVDACRAAIDEPTRIIGTLVPWVEGEDRVRIT